MNKAPGTANPAAAPNVHPAVPLAAPACGPLPATPVMPAMQPAKESIRSVEAQPSAAPGAGITLVQPHRVHPIVWASGLFGAFLLILWLVMR